MEEIQTYELKTNNFNNVKVKLESTLDDLEDELQVERKSKTNIEKSRRKLEGDVKRCLEVIDEKEKINNALKQTLSKREKELAHMVAKLDDEQTVIIKNVKQVKDLGGRVEELEEELETERQIRAKLENSRNLLNQELEELSDKLKEAHGSTDMQAAVIRRKEQEMLKLRRDMNEEHKVIENQMETAKRNFQKSFAEISEKLQNSENVNHR